VVLLAGGLVRGWCAREVPGAPSPTGATATAGSRAPRCPDRPAAARRSAP
jgi:hypothetical protein